MPIVLVDEKAEQVAVARCSLMGRPRYPGEAAATGRIVDRKRKSETVSPRRVDGDQHIWSVNRRSAGVVRI